MIVQDRIKKLNSALIGIFENKLEITGFYSEERLLDYYTRNIDCKLSFGIYPKEKFDVAYFKDNGLFILLEGSKEISRYKFIPIQKEMIKYKDKSDNKLKSVTFTIRKCHYTQKYSYNDMKENLVFDTEVELEEHFIDTYGFALTI